MSFQFRPEWCASIQTIVLCFAVLLLVLFWISCSVPRGDGISVLPCFQATVVVLAVPLAVPRIAALNNRRRKSPGWGVICVCCGEEKECGLRFFHLYVLRGIGPPGFQEEAAAIREEKKNLRRSGAGRESQERSFEFEDPR